MSKIDRELRFRRRFTDKPLAIWACKFLGSPNVFGGVHDSLGDDRLLAVGTSKLFCPCLEIDHLVTAAVANPPYISKLLVNLDQNCFQIQLGLHLGDTDIRTR